MKSENIKFKGWNTILERMSKPCSINEFPLRTQWHILDLLQWSGLFDKKGIEIYEGDICQTWFLGIKSEIVVVVKRHGSFWHKDLKRETYSNLHGTAKPYRKDNPFKKYYEVIGNIYENKDLL